MTDYRARTALAQPEAERASDEDLLGLDELRDSWNSQADAVNTWDELGIDEIIWFAQRQALARWGRPTPEPVPVSERLPEAEDCDSERRCWWLDRPFRNGPAVWVLRRTNDGILLPFIAWLPHWALPVPATTEAD